MKRFYVIFALLALACVGYAQQQKWKAPKRPKRPKWEAPKQLAPEVIDVWRPYNVSDNWFLDFYGGVSLSLAENMKGHGLGKLCRPMFDFGVGKQFSNVWTTRFTFGYKNQKGWASKQAMAVSSLLGDGDYTYHVMVLYVDEMLSLTKLFCPYNEMRKLDLQMFIGGGVNYSWHFDDKVDRWARYGYPVDGRDHVNWAARAGLLAMWKLNDTADLSLQGSYNIVNDNFNGVKHTNRFALDSYVDVVVGVRLHLSDHYGNSRYYKVRRWEATSLRTTESRVADLLEDERVKEYEARESAEVVAFGELMKTRISFYVDRTFVNDYQMENIRIVADFLKKHPEVNLIVRGYCGASSKTESPDMHLAERRVASVKKALVKYYGVDSSRFETWYDEETQAPFPMKGEWIDGVVFEMVRN
ncbi:MAG: OmpA family protein [Prevotellaceae bacterium]|nr:OmpA family protein [Prevotellaceae bacterium]